MGFQKYIPCATAHNCEHHSLSVHLESMAETVRCQVFSEKRLSTYIVFINGGGTGRGPKFVWVCGACVHAWVWTKPMFSVT